MKFAFIVDSCSVPSYYIDSKIALTFKDNKPIDNIACITPKVMVGMWSYPFIFNGCFLNWSEWGDDLPDYDLELIIVAIEKKFKDCTVDKLRKKYPNARIIGMIKEIFLGNVNAYGFSPAFESEKHKNRIKFLNECDAVIQPFPELEKSPITHLIEDCKNSVTYVPFPINVDYVYDTFSRDEKEESIFAYTTPTHGRRANTFEFAKHISNKYNIACYAKQERGGGFNIPLMEFYRLWSQCTFHFNLDPVEWFPGSQAVQVAAAGVINVGGKNASHKYLFPELATNDTNILEQAIENIISNPDERARVMKYAFDKVNELYSFNTVRQQIEGIKI